MTVSVSEALAHLLRREEARRAAGRERAERLRALLPEASQVLRSRFGAARVRLFGSLARAEASPESDVDLGVEGLPPEAQFEALAELMRIFGCAVGLVRLEEAPTSLRQRIAEEGEEV